MADFPTTGGRLAALRYRDFRLIWGGELISTIGNQMQLFAINWHVFVLLRGQTYTVALMGNEVALGAEALGLGIIGLVRVIPIIIFALIGGMLADSYDRRIVMLCTRIIAAAAATVLAVITLTGNESLNLIYAATAFLSATTALDTPARQSIVPHLVARQHLPNAVALFTLMFEISLIIGPALAGLLIAQFNIGVVYALNALTFIAAILALWALRYRGEVRAGSSGMGWQPLVEGLRFTFNTRMIRATMLLDFFATFFSSARTLLPIIAAEVLGLDALGYGLLGTAQSVGALIAGVVLALRKDIYRQGQVFLLSVAVYGLATALFGITTDFLLAYTFFALTGAGDTVSAVIRGTIRQVMTPDHLRGRMVSVNMIFFMGGPQLGELEAGVVAAVFGAPFAVFSGGVATILLTGWIAWRYPRLRNYTSDDTNAYLQTQTAATS